VWVNKERASLQATLFTLVGYHAKEAMSRDIVSISQLTHLVHDLFNSLAGSVIRAIIQRAASSFAAGPREALVSWWFILLSFYRQVATTPRKPCALIDKKSQ